MLYNPYVLELFQKPDGFSAIAAEKISYESAPKSTEQKIYDDYKYLFNSTNARVYTLLLNYLYKSLNSNTDNSTIKSKFKKLMNEWKEDTLFISDISKICTHSSYQQIIGMGENVIPLIISELKSNPDHWFWALKAITGKDPVPEEKKGNIREMSNIWIEWYAKQGFKSEADNRKAFP